MTNSINKHLTRFSQLVVIAGVMLSTNAFGFGGGNAADDYADNGGRAVIQQSVGFGCTMYRPGNLTANHAVIIWGNGTGSSPSTYASLLRHWASWGFVVVAANTSNAGTGSDMISCLNAVQSSSIGGQLSSQVGTSGHSQGGGGSIMAGRDSRVNATAPIQPYTAGLGHSSSSQSQQQGPMLLLSGSSDFIASPGINQAPVFSRANVPVFWATRSGASHFEPVGDGGDFRGISTAWFLYQLTGDDNAAELFEGNNCGFCNASGWDVERKGF